MGWGGGGWDAATERKLMHVLHVQPKSRLTEEHGLKSLIGRHFNNLQVGKQRGPGSAATIHLKTGFNHPGKLLL